MENKQIYVLDTNIILNNPNLEDYKGKTCYIPIEVMKELDRQKTLDGEVGFKARLFHRNLKEINKSDLSHEVSYNYKGVEILNPTVKLELTEVDGETFDKADTWFMKSQLLLDDKSAIAHTSDFSCFNLMRVNGRNAEYIDFKKSLTQHMTHSYTEVYVDPCVMSDLSKFKNFDNHGCMDYLLLVNNSNPTNKRLVKIRDGKLFDVKKHKVYGVSPKNLEQTILIDSLMDERVKAIILSARQGTGKTFLSLAGALEQTLHTNVYSRILLGKSQSPLSKSEEIGWLPGDIDQKLRYSMASYFTNLESLNNGAFTFEKDGNTVRFDGNKLFEQLNSKGIIDYLPLDSILGASFDNTVILIDEAQSLDFKMIRSALTRIKDSSKIVLLGDVLQGTSVMRSVDSSGLYIANKYLRDVNGVQILTLSEIERGEVCKNIADALDKIDF